MNNNRTWEALSMKDRASFIKLAMQNGYRDLDSIRNLYNDKNNILATGGPKENKSKRPISREEKAEAIIRSSNGINGKLNLSNIPELFSMNRWYNTHKVPQDFNASTVKGPFGAPTYSGIISVNNSAYVDPSEIQDNLDFVDAYMGRGIPMQQYGVIQKEDGRGERRILRNSINNNPNVKVYQTYPDTLNSKDVKYLDEQLRLGLPIKGDEVVNMSNDTNPYLFQIGDSDYSYDGSNISVIKVQLPDGSNAYKNVDVFDFNPDNWVYSIPAKGTEALRFLNNNGKPYIMTSPWYRSNKFDNRPSLGIPLPGESGGMALGGPLYNEDNPVRSFQGNSYIITSPRFYKEEWNKDIKDKYYKTNKFDNGGPTNDYNAILYDEQITAPIEEIVITGKSGLTEYKPGDKRYIDQIRKYTDRIYSGDLAIDAVPKHYRRGVENTIRGDQFANKVRKSRDENYKGLMIAMNAVPLAVGAQAILPAMPMNKITKTIGKINNLYTKYIPKNVRRGIKTTWEGFSLYDTIANLDDRIETAYNAFQDGKIGKGLFNTSLTLLDLAGIGSSINNAKKLGKKFVEKLPEFQGIDLEHPSMPAFIRNSNKAHIINNKVNTFLNSPSNITTYFLNKKFPQNQREEVWQRVVDYNNMQRIKGGLDVVSIPYNEKVIKAANRLDEIKNFFGKRTFDVGPVKALAYSRGKITDADYDVRFFLPALFRKDKYFSPRAIGAHELRHGIQQTFGTKQLGFFGGKPEQKVLSDLNDYNTEYGFSLSDLRGGSSTKREQKILENSKYRKNRIQWVKSLPEFDAEMSTFREVYQLDDSYNRWDSKHRNLFNDWSSKRFGISYDEAMEIAEGLSTKGYALGGPLFNQDNPIESFQGNPYIPIVRY